MGNLVPNLIICFILIGSLVTFHLFSNVIKFTLAEGGDTDNSLSQLVENHSKHYGWFLRAFVNCYGYLCVLTPGFLIYKYTTKIKYIDRSDKSSVLPAIIRICFIGSDVDFTGENIIQTNALRTAARECILLIYCFVGLMVSYLTWGVLQEKIMTTAYAQIKDTKIFFKDSQFLVFSNRVLAFFVALIYLICRKQLKQRAPLFKFSYASFSNIVSAWFQYEALKFVSFPTQVLAKSCKIIPVMIMGKIISKTKYEFYEYLTALLISIGMIFFLTGGQDSEKASSVTTLTGIFLLVLYMIFDSFTSNWQGDLFKTYSMNSMQMMCGVNLFSTLFTFTSLLLQGGIMYPIKFALQFPSFLFDCTILSLSSAIGQLFIFYTISTFGPVVFTIIMTIRQAVAVLLSCIIYKHNISFLGVIGVLILFFAIFLRVYCNQRLKAIRKKIDLQNSRLNV